MKLIYVLSSTVVAMAAVKDPMLQLSSDSHFHFEILRPLSLAGYEGSDIGEVLIAANQIKAGDYESFYSAFYSVASRVDSVARSIDKDLYPVSARNAFFKAATYYRSADFYLHGNWSDPRIYTLWDKHLDAFNEAIALLPVPGERITLRAKNDNFTIPAIFYGTGLSGRRPTMILGNGFDGAQEEMYHVIGQAALQRGINVITYEGPGQPTVRRQQDKGFIFDWEKVVTPVVDWAIAHKNIDPKAIGLLGYSLGGYFAPRAAAFEHRLAAIMAIDGVIEFGQLGVSSYPADIQAAYKAGDKEGFDTKMAEYLKKNTTTTATKWALEQGTWSFAQESYYEFLKKRDLMTLRNGVTDTITTPVFVADAELETNFPGQAKELANVLGDRATYRLFSAAEGAGAHCSIGGGVLQNQVLLDWFQDLVGDVRTRRELRTV